MSEQSVSKAYVGDGESEQGLSGSAARIAQLERERDAAIRIPADHVRLWDGRVVRVLGTLPMTADGCVALPGSFVYAKWWNNRVARGFVRYEVHGPDVCHFVEMTTTTDDGRTIGVRTFLSDCYSTRAAAEAARGEGSKT